MSDHKHKPAQLLKIAGLYKQKSKKTGKTYLTGKLNFQSRLLVLPNEAKTADSAPNEPDFNVFLVPIEEEKRKPKPAPSAKDDDDL